MNIIGDMLKTKLLTPAEGPHVTRVGPLLLYQTRPALKACCGIGSQWQSTVYFSVARRMIYFGYQSSYGLMCVTYFGITEDLVKCTLGSGRCGPACKLLNLMSETENVHGMIIVLMGPPF